MSITQPSATQVSANDGASGSLFTTVQGFVSYLLSSAGSSFVGWVNGLTGGLSRSVLNRLCDTCNVTDFSGVDPTGATDSYAGFQNAVNSGKGTVFVPPGIYTISEPIQVPFGVCVIGAGPQSTKVVNPNVGGGCFWNTGSTNPYSQIGPTICNLSLSADYPVLMNLPSVTLAGGSGSPALQQVDVSKNVFIPRVSGTGIAIQLVKCFDSRVMFNQINPHFAIGLFLFGSDISNISNNRFWACANFSILELAANYFGSQNEIRNNDILPSDASAIGIKSAGYHPRVYDNYIEAGSAAIGAIDFSLNGITSGSLEALGINIGSNVLNAQSYTICCEDNRIDTHQDFTGFIYQIDGNNNPRYLKLRDVGTTDAPESAPILNILGEYLPVSWSTGNPNLATYQISVPQVNGYTNFATEKTIATSSEIVINAENFSSLYGITFNNAYQYCSYDGSNCVLILPTFASVLEALVPLIDGSISPFEVGAYYELSITACTDSASGDTLRIAHATYDPLGGGAYVNLALTQDFKTYNFDFVQAPASPTLLGFDCERSTSNGNIKIAEIRFTKKIYCAVANLPTSPYPGDTAVVTDATSPTFLAAPTGGGSVHAPVKCVTPGSWIIA